MSVFSRFKRPASSLDAPTARFFSLARTHRLRRLGLTLIELVVVMSILAGLAALLVPRLSFLQQQSVSVTGAAGSQDLMNNLEAYRISTGFYPLRFDSLLNNAASAMATGTTTGAAAGTAFFQGPNGTPPLLPYAYQSITDVWQMASIGAAFGPTSGNYTVMDQDASATLAAEDISSSFNTARALYGDGTALSAAIVDPTNGSAIWQAAFPGGTMTAGTYTPPANATGVQLVAFGVGPQCSAATTTMSSAPLQVGMQSGYYARYVAIFALYGTTYSNPGKAADLKLVVDAYGNTASSNISSFRQSAPVNQ